MRMAQSAPTVGIDCSEERLDVHIHPLASAFSLANTPQGWDELHRRLTAESVKIVGIEASGGCERAVCRFLMDRGYSVRQLNPYRVRQFAPVLPWGGGPIGQKRSYRCANDRALRRNHADPRTGAA